MPVEQQRLYCLLRDIAMVTSEAGADVQINY